MARKRAAEQVPLGHVDAPPGHLGQLGFSLEEDISLPRRGQRKPLLRATLVEPALLDPERAILRPAIPLDMLVEKIEPPPVEVLPAPARTLDEVLALAEQAVAGGAAGSSAANETTSV